MFAASARLQHRRRRRVQTGRLSHAGEMALPTHVDRVTRFAGAERAGRALGRRAPRRRRRRRRGGRRRAGRVRLEGYRTIELPGGLDADALAPIRAAMSWTEAACSARSRAWRSSTAARPAMRLIHAVRELNERARRRRSASIALYTEPERHAMFVRQADEAVLPRPGDGRGARRRRRSALPRLRARSSARWSRRGPTPRGSAGASWPSTRVRRAVRAARASSSSAPTPTSCARWATRSRPSGWPRRPACRSRRGAAGPVETRRGGARATRERIGYPLMIKAAAGGGGRGIRRVDGAGRARRAPSRARAPRPRRRSATRRVLHGAARQRRPPRRGAGDRRRPRRRRGRSACATARCQRRNQKVIEESASPALDRRAGARARARRRVRLALRAGYRNAGTVEFLYEPGRAALLLHGGQHAPAGRAPRHRGGHRRSTSSSSSSTSPPAAGSRASRRRRAATRSRRA